ncbi:hypothetical protein BDFG_09275 [Blastomyces dermatitidis ATCC 26199]|nr:hypothetical protein BDFG_09275 [Blastomyces dermatitidis ATCC 26199]
MPRTCPTPFAFPTFLATLFTALLETAAPSFANRLIRLHGIWLAIVEGLPLLPDKDQMEREDMVQRILRVNGVVSVRREMRGERGEEERRERKLVIFHVCTVCAGQLAVSRPFACGEGVGGGIDREEGLGLKAGRRWARLGMYEMDG